MRGITESDLLMHRNNDRLDWDTRRAFDIVMRVCKPEELNPWLPIAHAPKDRPVLLYGAHVPICKMFVGYAADNWLWKPTHYQELPEDPE